MWNRAAKGFYVLTVFNLIWAVSEAFGSIFLFLFSEISFSNISLNWRNKNYGMKVKHTGCYQHKQVWLICWCQSFIRQTVITATLSILKQPVSNPSVVPDNHH